MSALRTPLRPWTETTRWVRVRAWLPGLTAALVLASQLPAQSPGRVHTTVERLSLERLESAHRDVLRYRQLRRELPPLPGLNDYRAIFHAHAGDSDHTGGTLPEILAAAHEASVQVIFLSDHFRPPRDFMDGWRGVRDGVLFIPGSEAHGFLLHPERSIFNRMQAPPPKLAAAAGRGDGLVFLSHLEDREDHSLERLTGMEIYNRHADAKDDRTAMTTILGWATDPDGVEHLHTILERYPDEVFAAQLDYPVLYLSKWDRETQNRRVVGVAANDCHHNQVFLVKKVDDETVRVGTVVDDDDEMRLVTSEQRPRIGELTAGKLPGAELVRFDFDPYARSMRNTSTHILAPELDERAIRDAVRSGHVYVSHDWMADPTGFRFVVLTASERRLLMGDEVRFASDMRARVELPLPAELRLIRNGQVVTEARGSLLEVPLEEAGVYRVEAWLIVDGEHRIWIYSNPIYLR